MTQSAFSGTGSPRNALALWALILGMASLVFSVVVVGAIIGLAAMVLGIIAVTRPGGKGKSIAGLITGALALPVAFVALSFWIFLLSGHAVAGRVEESRRAQTIAHIANLKTALEAFELDNGRFPSTKEGLAALVKSPPGMEGTWHQCIEAVPVDPWGHPFIYRCPGIKHPDSFDLISMGADGIEGTPDDIDENTLIEP